MTSSHSRVLNKLLHARLGSWIWGDSLLLILRRVTVQFWSRVSSMMGFLSSELPLSAPLKLSRIGSQGHDITNTRKQVCALLVHKHDGYAYAGSQWCALATSCTNGGSFRVRIATNSDPESIFCFVHFCQVWSSIFIFDKNDCPLSQYIDARDKFAYLSWYKVPMSWCFSFSKLNSDGKHDPVLFVTHTVAWCHQRRQYRSWRL